MRNLIFCFLSISVIILSSCEDQEPTVSLNCEKLTSREEAENLMSQVNDQRLLDSSTIVSNLIGEWGLIGVVPGWIGFEPAQECIRLTISSWHITLDDLKTDNDNASAWQLKSIEVNGYVGFYLETNEDTWNNRMGMEIFSDNFMFGSGRVDDANIYIYEKLQ